MNYGLQLWSVRLDAKENYENMLKEVAALGYEFVEPAGFFGHSAEEIKEWLEKYNLKISGTHSKFEELEEDFDATVKFHKTIGNKRFIIPHTPTNTKEELEIAVAKFNKFGPMLAEHGISLQYHNHHREFLPNNDLMYANFYLLDKTNIKFEIDTFWAYAANWNPIEVLEVFKDRIECIHLKDGIKAFDEDAKRVFNGKALGEGTAPVKDVIKKAKELGFTMVVESEGLDPTGLQEVGRCADFLKANG